MSLDIGTSKYLSKSQTLKVQTQSSHQDLPLGKSLSLAQHRHSFPSNVAAAAAAPRYQTFYLARPPATRSTSLALQLQRMSPREGRDGYSMATPIFDIKQNTPPMKKFLKKVRSFNDAVLLIIPPHNLSSDQSAPTKSRSASVQLPTSISTATFSVYDRDAPKDPVAQISQHGISFSQRTTPLLSRHSRLGRHESTNNHTSSLTGPVSWVVVEDRMGYKVLDRDTNAVIGKWQLQSSLGGNRRRSQVESEFQVLGSTVHDGRHFFSGSLLDNSIKPERMTWCFVVKDIGSNSDNTVVATLKGFELKLLMQQPNAVQSNVSMFLDEFTKALRYKSALNKSLNGVSNDTDRGISSEIQSTQQQAPPPVFPESVLEHSTASFYRLTFTDGVVMCAISLMLRLDEKIRTTSILTSLAASETASIITQNEDSTTNSKIADVMKRRSVSKPTTKTQASAVEVEMPAVSVQRRKSILKRMSFLKLRSFMNIKALHV